MPFLAPLSDEQRTTFVVISLPLRVLRRLVGALGTAPKGTRLDKLSVWDLAWTLVDFYGSDPQVSAEVDRALLREIGESPLAPGVVNEPAARALADLVLRAPDPLRDFAWAILSSGPEGVGPLAAEAVEAIVTEFDEAEVQAREREADAAPAGPEAAAPDPEEIDRRIERETRDAKRGRERALKRADDMKARVSELETALAEAHRVLKTERAVHAEADVERERLVEERERLRHRLQEGTAGEVARLARALEDERRQGRSLADALEQARQEGVKLLEELREWRAKTPASPVAESGRTERADPATFSLPVFTAEFYDSIKAWDRKILRIAFEKVVRLAEDWRHPSLRAIPLEGLPGHYRIRIASDVRLIYRVPEGGRLEILSLIDREDLTRYIRTAK